MSPQSLSDELPLFMTNFLSVVTFIYCIHHKISLHHFLFYSTAKHSLGMFWAIQVNYATVHISMYCILQPVALKIQRKGPFNPTTLSPRSPGLLQGNKMYYLFFRKERIHWITAGIKYICRPKGFDFL